MNTFLSYNLLSKRNDLKIEIESIPNIYHSKKTDALIKWVGILEAFESIKNNYDTIVNIGCGIDSLPIYFSKFSDNCYAIDLGEINPENKNHNIKSRNINFFDWNELTDNSVDIFIDSCAVTHFNVESNSEYKNIGITKTFEKVSSLLKDGGYFIITTDCVAEDTDSTEFVTPNYWIDSAKKYNMFLKTDFINPDDENYNNIPFGFVYNNYNLKVIRLIFQKI
jgi:hypothetical protein